MSRLHSNSRRRPQRGVTMVEVLVAMLVVSFGVLAVTGLLAAAARTGKTSEHRAVATLLASDIADRMRANKPSVRFGNYQMIATYEFPDAPPNKAADCVLPNACTEAEIAAQDLADWARFIYFNLPGGRGYVTYNAVDEAADVWVAWIDPKAAESESKAGDAKGDRQECPPEFIVDKGIQPRCMYFRVGM